MSNMDEYGYASGQKQQAGYIKRRLLPALNKYKKAIKIIGFVIFILIVAVFFFLMGRHRPLNCQHDDIKCPPDWIGHQGNCYKFSEEEKNWNESQNFCILYNASLAKITKKEVEFVRIFTRDHVYWVGLNGGPPWKWPDGDNATSDIMGHGGGGGGGNCAYLDDSGKAYPGRCTTEHRFICKKRILRDPEKS